MPAVRTAEWINLFFFCFMGGLAFLVPLRPFRRSVILLIGALGAGLVAAAPFLNCVLPPRAASIIRDWLPAPLILAAYHQGGQFFRRPLESL